MWVWKTESQKRNDRGNTYHNVVIQEKNKILLKRHESEPIWREALTSNVDNL